MNIKTHNIHTILLGLIAVVLAVGLFQTHKVKMDLDLTEQNNNTISVTGKAEREFAPDIATVSFYVTKQGPEQTVIANYVNKRVKEVVSALKELGIKEKDIKTSNYSLHPQYNWNDGKRSFAGYRARESVNITIRDLDKVSKVLARVVELGVDDVNGPNFRVDNLSEKKDVLRAEAIANAKAKANELAKELGVKVEKIVSFSEGDSGDYYPAPTMMYKRGLAVNSADTLEAPEINPGEQKITKTVTITFKIEN